MYRTQPREEASQRRSIGVRIRFSLDWTGCKLARDEDDGCATLALLHLAARNGILEVAQLLLQHGAVVYLLQGTRGGKTSMHQPLYCVVNGICRHHAGFIGTQARSDVPVPVLVPVLIRYLSVEHFLIGSFRLAALLHPMTMTPTSSRLSTGITPSD